MNRLAWVMWLGLGCLPGACEDVARGGKPFGASRGAIIGGQEISGLLFVGALLEQEELICTGTLIGARTVLTAGHCLRDVRVEELAFVLGDVALFPEQRFGVARAMVHPGFGPQHHDVAVLELDRAADATPARLLPALDEGWTGRGLLAVGYGRDEQQRAGRRKGVVLPIAALNPNTIFFFAPGKSGCHGDSGGPAFFEDPAGGLWLAGITSYGSVDCGDYGVYTRADAYGEFIVDQRAWIEEGKRPPADLGYEPASVDLRNLAREEEGSCLGETLGRFFDAAGRLWWMDCAASGMRCQEGRCVAPCEDGLSRGHCAGSVLWSCDRGVVQRTDCQALALACRQDPRSGEAGCGPVEGCQELGAYCDEAHNLAVDCYGNGRGWIQPCGAGTRCVVDGTRVTCSECAARGIPAHGVCEGDFYLTCDGQGALVRESCATERRICATDIDGEIGCFPDCRAAGLTPGESRCAGQRLIGCDTLDGFFEQDCAAAQGVCALEGGVARCRFDCAALGFAEQWRHCQGNRVQGCTPQGGVREQDCAETGEICVDDLGIEARCVKDCAASGLAPGESRCAGALALRCFAGYGLLTEDCAAYGRGCAQAEGGEASCVTDCRAAGFAEGIRHCRGPRLEECSPEGGLTRRDCRLEGQTCVEPEPGQARCSLGCEARGLSALESRCEGDRVLRCDPDVGMEEEDCAARGARCALEEGQARCATDCPALGFQDGESRCEGDSLRRCERTLGLRVSDCAAQGKRCARDEEGRARCLFDCAAFGLSNWEARCVGGTLVRCDEHWGLSREDCAAGGRACQQPEGVEARCE